MSEIKNLNLNVQQSTQAQNVQNTNLNAENINSSDKTEQQFQQEKPDYKKEIAASDIQEEDYGLIEENLQEQ